MLLDFRSKDCLFLRPQWSENIFVMKYSHGKCVDGSFFLYFLLTCYEIVCFSIKSTVHYDAFVVDMFFKSFCADCFTHLCMFSDDWRMFSWFCQNTRFSQIVNLTVMYDFNTVKVTKWKPNSVVRLVLASCWDILKVMEVVVLIIFNHCRHLFLVTFFFLSAGGFLTIMWLLLAKVKMTFTLETHQFAMAT